MIIIIPGIWKQSKVCEAPKYLTGCTKGNLTVQSQFTDPSRQSGIEVPRTSEVRPTHFPTVEFPSNPGRQGITTKRGQ